MWDKVQFKDDGFFKISYRYNGVIREATVEEVRLSSRNYYWLRSEKHFWDVEKKNGQWRCTSPHQMKPGLMKAIGAGIDAWLAKRGY